MDKYFSYRLLVVLVMVLIFSGRSLAQEPAAGMDVLVTRQQAAGTPLEIHFKKGLEHYHPLMAIWVEDLEGNFEHTLYVAHSYAKGVFGHARYEDARWKAGKKMIPAALPYWSHRRKHATSDTLLVPTPENPIPDAYTGATPTGDFMLKTVVEDTVPDRFRVLFEINQSWDWNQHWYNSKYPGNEEYMKSAQPALVYEAVVDLAIPQQPSVMKPIGHSHPFGATGELFEDISTLTSARHIAERITVRIGKSKRKE